MHPGQVPIKAEGSSHHPSPGSSGKWAAKNPQGGGQAGELGRAEAQVSSTSDVHRTKKMQIKDNFKDFKVATTEHCTPSGGSPSECRTLCLCIGYMPLKVPHTISIQQDKMFSSLSS